LTNDTIAFVHIFGGSSQGPYYSGWSNSPTDLFVDTKPRIEHAMQLYYKEYPPPDRIIYHSAQWDVKLCNVHEPKFTQKFNESTKIFEININERLNQIMDLAKQLSNGTKQTSVGLRTAVFNPGGHEESKDPPGTDLLHTFNTIIRETAERRNLTLYDLDTDVWSVVDWNYSREKDILRDAIHPIPEYCSSAAEKMLSRRYSSNFIYKGVANEDIPTPWFGEGLRTRREMEVSLLGDISSNKDVEANRTYAVLKSSDGKISRHGHVNSFFMNFGRLNEGDVYHLSKTELDLIPLGPPLPHALTHVGGVINTTIGHLYLVLDHDLRSLPTGPEVLNLFNIHSNNITSNVDEEWIKKSGKKLPVSNIYHENTLFRAQNEKVVYAFQNGQKRPINNVGVFFAHGWDFNDVIIVTDLLDMERIPYGDPLQ
jgi:hypothetical protein